MLNKKNLYYYYLSKALPGLFGFIFFIVSYNLLGAEVVGIFSYCFSLVLLVVTFGSTWIKQSILRYYTDLTNDDKGSVFVLSCSTMFVISIIFSCLMNASIFFSIKVNSSVIFLLSFSMFLQTLLFTFCQVEEQAKKIAIGENIRGILFLASPFIVYFFDGSVDLLLFVVSLSYMLSAFILFGSKIIKSFKFNDKKFKAMFKYGWPMSVWLSLVMAIPYIDKQILLLRSSSVVLGDYSSLYEMYTRVFGLIFAPLVLYFHPIIMKVYSEKGLVFARRVIFKAIKAELAIFSILLIANIIFGKNIISFFFPGITDNILKITSLLLAQGFIWQLAVLAHKELEIANKTTHMMQIMIALVLLHFLIVYSFYDGTNVYIFPLSSLFLGGIYCILTSFYARLFK